MPWNGSGSFDLAYTWSIEATNPPIEFSKFDAEMTNLKQGLEACLTRDNQTLPSQDANWNGKRLFNLAQAVSSGDAAAYQAGSFLATLNDVSGVVTGTMNYVRVGSLVHLRAPANIVGTSNSTNLAIVGLPPIITPNSTIRVGFNSGVCNDGTTRQCAGWATINTLGTVQIVRTVDFFSQSIVNGAFTPSGDKGLLQGFALVYSVA